jgi:hypothetical protein
MTTAPPLAKAINSRRLISITVDCAFGSGRRYGRGALGAVWAPLRNDRKQRRSCPVGDVRAAVIRGYAIAPSSD